MTRWTGAIWAAWLFIGVNSQVAKAQNSRMPAAADEGKLLFTGEIHFRNGGPACIACHTIAGIPFPNGGTLGPDLTGAYAKLGPTGTQSALQTLYFKVMTPIYTAHPLMPDEQVDLTAFLEQAGARAAGERTTPVILLAAFLFGLILVGITAWAWRDRLTGVRAGMVERARQRQGVKF